MYGDQTYKTAPAEYDDDVLQSNIAMLGFKVAVNGSLTRYNLVDQSIDEFYDTSGVDASASTNDDRVASGSNYYYVGGSTTTPSITTDADSSTVDGDYTYYKWTTVTTTGDYTNNTTQDHQWLVVAGGGGGGGGASSPGGGGGAGGFRAGASLSLTGGTTYTVKVGAGGAKDGDGGDSELSGTGITTVTSTGGGAGGGSPGPQSGQDGGSGGGRYGHTSPAVKGDGNTPAITPITGETTTVQGFDGGTGYSDDVSYTNSGGGGGASEVGESTSTGGGGDGGDGTSNSITGAAVTYAGGGGGSTSNVGGRTGGTGGAGGGGNGAPDSSASTPGTDGLGGGGGGGYAQVGGSGIVILRRLTNIATTGSDLTLQSTDVTAEAEADFGEFVTLIENAYGTATLNTDIKGYVSRDSGTTFTQGTLVDEGTWGTNKQVLGFHDLDISSQPSGTSMCYKITTHNQAASSKETRIYATSIGWR